MDLSQTERGGGRERGNIYREGDIRGFLFYLTTRSAHFIYGYMASNIW